MNDELKKLVEDYCNGTLDDDAFAQLQETLRNNPEARAHFRSYLNLDTALFDAASVEESGANAWGEKKQAAAVAAPTNWSNTWMPAAAAVAIFLVAGALVIAPRLLNETGTSAAAGEDTSSGFAILTELIDAEWQDGCHPHAVGDALSPGHVMLKSGVAQIEFYSGATVLLEGESDFEIISAQRAYCHRGKLRATVPPAARGFTIGTPESDVVDLGTEFGLSVGKDGASEVHVFDGEVELHEKGNSVKSLKTGEALSLGDGASMPADAGAFATLDSFARVSEQEQRARFDRWKEHSLQLRQDPRLIVYYPCDQPESWQRRVINEAGDAERRGAMVGVTRTQGRWPWKSAVEFRRPGDRVRLFIPGEYSSLTLACWVRLDSVDRMWNSLYLTDGYEQGEVHWQITEGKLAYSMRIRDEGKFKQHLYFSPVFWSPELSGQWIHLATVYDAGTTEVTHYLNGRDLSSETAPENGAVPVTRFGAGEIGNWGLSIHRTDPEFVVRSLNGLMDEFAIFSDALSPAEIKAMHDAGSPHAPR